MLPKKNRADKKLVERTFKEGKFINSPNLTFKFILTNNSTVPRISFIAPKNVAKLAVQRNLLRRRGYSILGKYMNQFPLGLIGVFIFKTRPNGRGLPVGREYQDDVSILENEIKNVFAKIN
jgi:ribonuclease P protein component